MRIILQKDERRAENRCSHCFKVPDWTWLIDARCWQTGSVLVDASMAAQIRNVCFWSVSCQYVGLNVTWHTFCGVCEANSMRDVSHTTKWYFFNKSANGESIGNFGISGIYYDSFIKSMTIQTFTPIRYMANYYLQKKIIDAIRWNLRSEQKCLNFLSVFHE